MSKEENGREGESGTGRGWWLYHMFTFHHHITEDWINNQNNHEVRDLNWGKVNLLYGTSASASTEISRSYGVIPKTFGWLPLSLSVCVRPGYLYMIRNQPSVRNSSCGTFFKPTGFYKAPGWEGGAERKHLKQPVWRGERVGKLDTCVGWNNQCRCSMEIEYCRYHAQA